MPQFTVHNQTRTPTSLSLNGVQQPILPGTSNENNAIAAHIAESSINRTLGNEEQKKLSKAVTPSALSKYTPDFLKKKYTAELEKIAGEKDKYDKAVEQLKKGASITSQAAVVAIRKHNPDMYRLFVENGHQPSPDDVRVAGLYDDTAEILQIIAESGYTFSQSEIAFCLQIAKSPRNPSACAPERIAIFCGKEGVTPFIFEAVFKASPINVNLALMGAKPLNFQNTIRELLKLGYQPSHKDFVNVLNDLKPYSAMEIIGIFLEHGYTITSADFKAVIDKDCPPLTLQLLQSGKEMVLSYDDRVKYAIPFPIGFFGGRFDMQCAGYKPTREDLRYLFTAGKTEAFQLVLDRGYRVTAQDFSDVFGETCVDVSAYRLEKMASLVAQRHACTKEDFQSVLKHLRPFLLKVLITKGYKVDSADFKAAIDAGCSCTIIDALLSYELAQVPCNYDGYRYMSREFKEHGEGYFPTFDDIEYARARGYDFEDFPKETFRKGLRLQGPYFSAFSIEKIVKRGYKVDSEDFRAAIDADRDVSIINALLNYGYKEQGANRTFCTSKAGYRMTKADLEYAKKRGYTFG